MLNKILNSRFTPFILLSGLFAVYVLLIFLSSGNDPQGWGSIIAFMFGVAIVVMMVIDMLLWRFVKPGKRKWIWIGEFLAAVAYFIFLKFF